MSAPTTASYFICCSPRSGSWLLADAMRMTGLAGVPEEYYWHEFYDDYCGHWQLPPFEHFGQFLAQTLRVGTTGNGMFGAKLHWDELQELCQSLRTLPGSRDLDALGLLRRYFPRPVLIYLHRGDKVRQAISWYRAVETLQWYAVDGEPQRCRNIEPDWDRLLRLERKLRDDERSWERLFAVSGAQPLRISYEGLLRDYEAMVERALRWIGVELPGTYAYQPPRLKRQRDETTEEWVQRYLVARRTLWPTDDEMYGLRG